MNRPADKDGSEARRVPFLALPYPLVDYMFTLKPPADRILLRGLQRATWSATTTPDGIQLDAGELLMSYRSTDLWRDVLPDMSEGARRSVVRRAFAAFARDGLVELRPARPAHPSGPQSGPPPGPPPTVAKFVNYREILWTSTAVAAHPPAHLPAHPPGPIPPSSPPSSPDQPEDLNAHVTARSKKSSSALPLEVKRVRRAIAQRIGRKNLALPASADDRRLVVEVFSEWIADEGEHAVVRACEREARRMALEGAGQQPYSLLYLAKAADRVRDADMPDLPMPEFGEEQRPGRWKDLERRMTPAQYAVYLPEAEALAGSKDDAAWSALHARWAAMVRGNAA